MSCRVLGRRVEEMTVQLMVERARQLGCLRLVGRYTPTSKNGIVENLYPQHAFIDAGQDGATRLYALDIGQFQPRSFPIEVQERELTQS